jgi:hypothetical protein
MSGAFKIDYALRAPIPWTARECQQGQNGRWLSAHNFVSILGRAGTADPPEHPRKVLLRFESARHGYVKNPHLGLAQHLLCAFYPLPQDKLMRALACRLPKRL